MAPLTSPKHGWTRHRLADGIEDEAWKRKINARDRRCWHCGSQEGIGALRHLSKQEKKDFLCDLARSL